MSDDVVRLLGPDDLALLCAAPSPDVFDLPVDARLAEEFLRDPRHHIAVALDGDAIVGMASGVHYVHPDKPAQLFINEVAVAPSHQGRGLGRRVVSALLDHARTLGCAEAWVLTSPSNAGARRMYAAAGGAEFEELSVMVEYDLTPGARATS